MKNSFLEYQGLLDTEISELWLNGLIIFDTNTLLNLYRYSEMTTNSIIEILESLNKQIFLPFQVGKEFYKNRLSVINENIKIYNTFKSEFEDLVSSIKNESRNPFFKTKTQKLIENVFEEVDKETKEKIEYFEKLFSKDDIKDKIENLFSNKINKEQSDDSIQKLFKEGELRYKLKIPPGYKDDQKHGNDKFGDYIIWKEIIEISKNQNKDIIFVTSDNKEDWWLINEGKTISPRPELIKEFHKETLKRIHFYKPFQFLRFANDHVDSKISDQVIEEVKNLKENPSKISDDNSIEICWLLSGNFDKIYEIFNELESNGYVVKIRENIGGTIWINIFLPNFPDLARRLNSIYLKKFQGYDIQLMESEVFIPTEKVD